MSENLINGYRLRLSKGGWYVRLYASFDLSSLVSELGPFSFAEAETAAKETGHKDLDKGIDNNGQVFQQAIRTKVP